MLTSAPLTDLEEMASFISNRFLFIGLKSLDLRVSHNVEQRCIYSVLYIFRITYHKLLFHRDYK